MSFFFVLSLFAGIFLGSYKCFFIVDRAKFGSRLLGLRNVLCEIVILRFIMVCF